MNDEARAVARVLVLGPPHRRARPGVAPVPKRSCATGRRADRRGGASRTRPCCWGAGRRLRRRSERRRHPLPRNLRAARHSDDDDARPASARVRHPVGRRRRARMGGTLRATLQDPPCTSPGTPPPTTPSRTTSGNAQTSGSSRQRSPSAPARTRSSRSGTEREATAPAGRRRWCTRRPSAGLGSYASMPGRWPSTHRPRLPRNLPPGNDRALSGLKPA